MNHRLLSTGSLAAAALASATAGQNTLIVPSQYPTVPAAVAAAYPGDTILVRAGSYDDIGTITEGIAILCDPGVVFTRLGIGGSFVVDGIPAGQTFVWRGGQIVTTFPHQWQPFEFRSCQGGVVVEGLARVGGVGPSVTGCSHVSLHGIALPVVLGITSSSVSISECAAGWAFIQSSRVAIARSTFRHHSAAIVSRLSHVTVGSGAVLEGGAGSGPAPAIDATGGTLRIDPGALLISGTAPIQGTATVTFESVPTTTAAMIGQTFVAEILAAPGSTTATFASPPVAPLTLPFGDLWVSPSSPILDMGTVPATGIRRVMTVVPAIPPGIPMVLQPVSLLQPTNQLALGAPTGVVLD